MPYTCKLNNGQYELTKKNSTSVIGSHDSRKACMKQMRAIYANEVRNEDNIIFDRFVNVPWDFENKVERAEKEIHVVINTSGGDFLDAIVVHNKLRNSGKRVIVHIDPFAFSAGAVIALAGDEIYMPENGLIKFHTPRAAVQTVKDADGFQALVDGLRKAEEVLVKTLMSRLRKTEEECRELMNKDEYLTANEALKMGIIDEIVPIYRDSESNITNYNFPERIVNYIEEKRDMPLKEVLEKFNVTDEDALVNLITNLQKNQSKQPVEIKPSIVNMVKNTRQIQLDRLVELGVQTPAVIGELKTTFLNEDRIKFDAQLDDPNGDFDKMVKALEKNDQVLNFDGKTGPQRTKLDKKEDEKNEDDDILAKEMKQRREREAAARIN